MAAVPFPGVGNNRFNLAVLVLPTRQPADFYAGNCPNDV